MSKIEMAGPWVNDDDIEIVLDALKNGWYKFGRIIEETYIESEYGASYDSIDFNLKAKPVKLINKEVNIKDY